MLVCLSIYLYTLCPLCASVHESRKDDSIQFHIYKHHINNEFAKYICVDKNCEHFEDRTQVNVLSTPKYHIIVYVIFIIMYECRYSYVLALNTICIFMQITLIWA